MLAALTPEQLERFWRAPSSRRFTPKSITGAEPLRREIAEVRRAGHGHRRRRIRRRVALRGAAGARFFSGQVIGAIGISGPVWRLSIEALQKRARIVRAAADRLSAEFGYAGDIAREQRMIPKCEPVFG